MSGASWSATVELMEEHLHADSSGGYLLRSVEVLITGLVCCRMQLRVKDVWRKEMKSARAEGGGDEQGKKADNVNVCCSPRVDARLCFFHPNE